MLGHFLYTVVKTTCTQAHRQVGRPASGQGRVAAHAGTRDKLKQGLPDTKLGELELDRGRWRLDHPSK